MKYVCGSVLSEYCGDVGNRDLIVLEKVFARENLACSANIELPYYSNSSGKVIYIFCGKGGKDLIISEEAYPKCQKCKDKKDVIKRKRKTIMAKDLQGAKKKK